MPRLRFSDPDAHPAVDVFAGYPLGYDAALLVWVLAEVSASNSRFSDR